MNSVHEVPHNFNNSIDVELIEDATYSLNGLQVRAWWNPFGGHWTLYEPDKRTIDSRRPCFVVLGWQIWAVHIPRVGKPALHFTGHTLADLEFLKDGLDDDFWSEALADLDMGGVG